MLLTTRQHSNKPVATQFHLKEKPLFSIIGKCIGGIVNVVTNIFSKLMVELLADYYPAFIH
ncbi:MAG: hypothetical protein JST81_05950 [Bacteroidetes bacterium]|nr:hypothetical protein [Bacteroidota bacterium]